jgi:cell wall-associated NlpC family hydrolase
MQAFSYKMVFSVRLFDFCLLKKDPSSLRITKILIAPLLFVYFNACLAMEIPIYDFPITAYSQNANDYLSPNDEHYTEALLSPDYQQAQLRQFYNHYYSSSPQGLSPWSPQMVISALPLIKKIEPEVLDEFNNLNQSAENKHYAENFKEHDPTWWNKIRENIDLSTLAASEFKEDNRAIAINNTPARALPDIAPDFFHASLPGQGFPFDNLQESSVWAGTPLYVVSVSKNKAWSLVLTPDGYFAWVKSNDIAYASSNFIKQWQDAAQYGLVAVTKTEASIMDPQEQFQFTAYIGAVFPLRERDNQQTTLLIAAKNNYHQAVIKAGLINNNASSIMPLAASAKNVLKLIKQLKNRPYGWGGAFFFNDCSQEMKSIFTPLGIWLPRNSAQQAKSGASLDLSNNTVDERLKLLQERGHPLMTIIYIGGHVMLYVAPSKAGAITYQNIWGLAPSNRDKRYVIGQSVFLPLLKYYAENSDASSLADKAIFKLVYLDELNGKADSPQGFARKFLESMSVQ